MSSSYSHVVRGKLSFKGEKPKAPKATSSASSSSSSANITGNKRARDSDEISSSQQQSDDVPEIQILTGVGRITSSGTVIHGHFTEFMRQLSVGDAIIIKHPTT